MIDVVEMDSVAGMIALDNSFDCLGFSFHFNSIVLSILIFMSLDLWDDKEETLSENAVLHRDDEYDDMDEVSGRWIRVYNLISFFLVTKKIIITTATITIPIIM